MGVRAWMVGAALVVVVVASGGAADHEAERAGRRRG